MSVKYRSIPTKTLAQNLSSSGTTLYLNNTLDWDDAQLSSADFGTQAFALLRNASNTQIELIEIDPTTVTSAAAITISKRGLGYDGTQSANTETKYNWSAFDTYVELGSDTPQMLQYLKDYIDGISIAGVSDAGLTAKGIVEIATQTEMDAGDDTGSTTAPTVVTPSIVRAKMFHDYAADSVGTDSYAITITPAITAYTTGQVFTFKAGTANTGACSLNVSALGAKTLKKNYNEDLVTGDIVANQIVMVEYDGTNMQVISRLPAPTPTVQTFTNGGTITLGSTTTQFDITNTAGSTYRYTWDTTGTDPGITAITVPTGIVVMIENETFNDANTGSFVVTGSGVNYFEVTNSAGVAESNKTLQNGYLKIVTAQTYTKPSNLKYAIVEVQGAGAGGTGGTGATDSSAGGGGGAYSRKLFAASAIGSTETVYVGPGGLCAATSSVGAIGGAISKFGSLLIAPGGGTQVSGGSIYGGVASGGDFNVDGGVAESSTASSQRGGAGGCSFLGHGAGGSESLTPQAGSGYGGGGAGSGISGAGGQGAPGIIIVTEYYS